MTTLEGLTEDAYTTAVEAAVDLVREKHPDLDLRSGTAVRALVIEPGALLDASQRETVTRLKTAMSLQTMAREGSVPREDAEAVLSNFGVTLGGGTKATGLVRINLIGTAPVTVRSGVVFTTEDAVSFVVTKTVSASVDPAEGEAEIRSSDDGRYYFTVPVEASEVGSNGNILQGHALSASVVLTNYYSAEAFSDFSGGEDGETVASAVARIPAALAYRGMTNALSVRAQLSANLSDPSVLRAVSCVGHRNRAQLRDKHNPLGLSVGGRVDVYARLFDAPGVVSFVTEGTLVETTADPTSTTGNVVGKYRIVLPAYPGFYAVKYIGPADQPSRQGSLQYDLVRTAVAGAADNHDFLVPSDPSGLPVNSVETAWSAYQEGVVFAYDNVDGESHIVTEAQASSLNKTVSASAVPVRPTTASFKVDLYWTSGVSSLQTLVDSAEVCNIAADYVVRMPAICLVNLHATVRPKAGVTLVAAELEEALYSYINGRSFVPRLTRSEIANVLLQHGAESVDLSAGGMYLGGRICGADGVWYYLDGDSLDVSAVGPENAMLTEGTVVFAAEPGAVQITVTT